MEVTFDELAAVGHEMVMSLDELVRKLTSELLRWADREEGSQLGMTLSGDCEDILDHASDPDAYRLAHEFANLGYDVDVNLVMLLHRHRADIQAFLDAKVRWQEKAKQVLWSARRPATRNREP